jgi:hypothetical protein
MAERAMIASDPLPPFPNGFLNGNEEINCLQQLVAACRSVLHNPQRMLLSLPKSPLIN